MKQSNKVAYGAMLLAIYILMLIASLVVPFLMLVSLFILPIPFVLYARKFGSVETIVFFVGGLLISALISVVYALPLTLFVGLGGLLIGDAMHRKKHAYEILIRGAAGFIVGFVLTALISQFVFDVNLVTAYENTLDESYEMSESFLETTLNQTLTDEQKEFQKAQLENIKNLLPSILVLLAVVFAFVTQWVTYKWINRQETEKKAFPPFRDFRLPASFIWIYLLVLIVEMVQMGEFTSSAGIANVALLARSLVVLHGLAFIFYYAFMKKWSIVIPIVVLILALIIPPLLFFVQLLGIIDLGFRLRDRLSAK